MMHLITEAVSDWKGYAHSYDNRESNVTSILVLYLMIENVADFRYKSE